MRVTFLASVVAGTLGLASPMAGQTAQPAARFLEEASKGCLGKLERICPEYGIANDAPVADEVDPNIPLLLRFQLIKASATKTTEPALAGLDSALKDLFRFPGYKLMSSAAISTDYTSPAPGARNANATKTDQLLTSDGTTYHLLIVVDTATSQIVRLNVLLYRLISAAGPEHQTLLQTTVTISYGRTIVLGSTQPTGLPSADGLAPTLILTVKPETR